MFVFDIIVNYSKVYATGKEKESTDGTDNKNKEDDSEKESIITDGLCS